jgi:hypothetical protein
MRTPTSGATNTAPRTSCRSARTASATCE